MSNENDPLNSRLNLLTKKVQKAIDDFDGLDRNGHIPEFEFRPACCWRVNAWVIDKNKPTKIDAAGTTPEEAVDYLIGGLGTWKKLLEFDFESQRQNND